MRSIVITLSILIMVQVASPMEPYIVYTDPEARRVEVVALDKEMRKKIDFEAFRGFLESECKKLKKLTFKEDKKETVLDLEAVAPTKPWKRINDLELEYQSGDCFWHLESENRWIVVFDFSPYFVQWTIEYDLFKQFSIVSEEIINADDWI